MNAFGLTGNIGCGKSTVAELLSKYPGVLVLDTDRIAKEIISSTALRKEINAILGVDVFSGGTANFAAIATVIFKDTEKKREFEALIHPLVWTDVEEKVAVAKTANPKTVCIVESAIIYETASERMFLAVIVAVCNEHEQLRRLKEIRGMSEKTIHARIAQQLPSEEKEDKAKLVINTDYTLEELTRRVHTLYRILTE